MTTSIYLFAVNKVAPEAISAPSNTASDGMTLPGFAFIHDHNRNNGIKSLCLYRRDIVGDDDLAGGDVVALADVGREAFALQLDGVQTEVDQDTDVLRGHDDVGVWHELQDLAADRGDSVDHPARRVDGGAVAHHALGEDGVGDVLQAEPHARATGARTGVVLTVVTPLLVRINNTSVPESRSHFGGSRLSFRSASAAGDVCGRGRSPK